MPSAAARRPPKRRRDAAPQKRALRRAAHGRAGRPRPAPQGAKGRGAGGPARPQKRVKTAPRIYNETVEEGQAPAGEDAFGPVVRVGGAVPAAHGKKAEKAVKAEAQEAEKDVWAHPAKDEATEQTTFAEDLTIEPDEYELPDDEAPFDVPPTGKKAAAQIQEGRARPGGRGRGRLRLPAHRPCLPTDRPPDRRESDQSDMEKAQLLGDTLRSFGIEDAPDRHRPRPGGDAL